MPNVGKGPRNVAAGRARDPCYRVRAAGRVRGCELGKELTADERTCRIVRICRPQTIQRNLVLRLCGILKCSCPQKKPQSLPARREILRHPLREGAAHLAGRMRMSASARRDDNRPSSRRPSAELSKKLPQPLSLLMQAAGRRPLGARSDRRQSIHPPRRRSTPRPVRVCAQPQAGQNGEGPRRHAHLTCLDAAACSV